MTMEDLTEKTDTKEAPVRIRYWHGRTLTQDTQRHSESRRASVKAGTFQGKVETKEIKMGKRGIRTVYVSHKIKKT